MTTNKGRPFPRKFPNKQKGLDEYFHKGKTKIELQTRPAAFLSLKQIGFVNGPTSRHRSRRRSISSEKSTRRRLPSAKKRLSRRRGLLTAGEQLEVKINDASFKADIQSTEGIALSQYGSLLKEHERSPHVNPVMTSAQKILDDAKHANRKIKPMAKLDNLLGFLQVIINYTKRAQIELWDTTKADVVKATFRLMHRTDFSSMFTRILNADEKTLFRQIVQSDAIPKELGIAAGDQFFKTGYWGHYGGTMALFRDGEIVALAVNDTTIHDCSSTANTPGVDKKKCGKSVPGARDHGRCMAEEHRQRNQGCALTTASRQFEHGQGRSADQRRGKGPGGI